MPPKPFSLDVVLKIRKRKEDLAQQKFAKALAELKQIDQMLNTANNKLQEMISLLESKQQHGILAVELDIYDKAIRSSRTEIESLGQRRREKQQICDNKRKHLVAKRRDHKMLETLKEHQNRTWKQYQDKKEANMLDEIAILHHNR